MENRKTFMKKKGWLLLIFHVIKSFLIWFKPWFIMESNIHALALLCKFKNSTWTYKEHRHTSVFWKPPFSKNGGRTLDWNTALNSSVLKYFPWRLWGDAHLKKYLYNSWKMCETLLVGIAVFYNIRNFFINQLEVARVLEQESNLWISGDEYILPQD